MCEPLRIWLDAAGNRALPLGKRVCAYGGHAGCPSCPKGGCPVTVVERRTPEPTKPDKRAAVVEPEYSLCRVFRGHI